MVASDEQFQASSFEAFYDSVSFSRECFKSRFSNGSIRKSGVLKEYLKVDSLAVAHVQVPYPPHQLYFVVHRVPPPGRNGHCVHKVGPDFPAGPAGGHAGDGQSNCMLFVGDGGERTDRVVASGVAIRSRIWLMTGENIPKPLVDAAFLQESHEIRWPLRPRVIHRLGGPPRGEVPGCERSLIERVPESSQRLGGLPPESSRKGLHESNLKDLLACIRIDLSDADCRVRLKEIPGSGVELRNCLVCPTDRLLRFREFSLDGLPHDHWS